MAKLQMITNLARLNQLFKNKKWHNNAGSDIAFENFCYLINNLNEEGRELVFDLCERYEWFSFNEYGNGIVKIFEELIKSIPENCKKLYFFPIMKPKDEDKVKSANSLLYQVMGFKGLLPELFQSIEFIKLEKFASVSQEKFTLDDNALFVLVDDFLGSGGTIKDCIGKIEENKTIKKSIMRVLSLVALEESSDWLKDEGIIHETRLKVQRGISDFYASPAKEEKIKIMEKIEEMIPRLGGYKFGYERSEGLVTMLRTPNNTFPIFWMDHKKKDEIYKAPFPRH